jgi:hypothetical protein
MNTSLPPTPHYISIDFERARIRLDGNEQCFKELAVTFREDGEAFLAEFKRALTEGRDEATLDALLHIEKLAMEMYAEPIATLCRRGKHLLRSPLPNHLLVELIPELETALQGTVNMLRSKGLLQQTDRIQEPVERPTASGS